MLPWLVSGAGVVVAAVIVLGISLDGGGSGAGSGSGGPGTTALCEEVSNQPAPTSPPPATTTFAPVTPVAASFTLTVTILTQQCFGSAGCDVTYRVTPHYSGPATSGSRTVTYPVTGTEGDTVGSFTYDADSGQVTFDREDSAQTTTDEVKLAATATALRPD